VRLRGRRRRSLTPPPPLAFDLSYKNFYWKSRCIRGVHHNWWKTTEAWRTSARYLSKYELPTWPVLTTTKCRNSVRVSNFKSEDYNKMISAKVSCICVCVCIYARQFEPRTGIVFNIAVLVYRRRKLRYISISFVFIIFRHSIFERYFSTIKQ